MTNKRLSNFDLMKIISMLMIILGHILGHGKIIENTTGNLNIFLNLLMFTIVIHVNSFVLVTGYFQHKKEFKLSKAISLNNAMWFYKAIIMIIFIFFGITTLTKIEIFQNLMPINYWDYWFIAVYIFLYLSSPLLNIIIKNITKKQYQMLLLILFFIVSLLSTLTNQLAYNSSFGYSLSNFILLYFIGAYISKYDIKFLKNLKENTKKGICVVVFLLCIFINFGFYFKTSNLNTNNEFLLYLRDIISNSSLSYSNPLIIMQSICYFYFFQSFRAGGGRKPLKIQSFINTEVRIYL